jgi:hypothetical protein
MSNGSFLPRVVLPGATALAFLLTLPALAGESKCELRDQAGFVAVLICPQGLEQEDLKNAGETACGTRMDCQGWIWDDAVNAPEKAPETPEDLTQEQISSSVGIWVNGNQNLITLEKVD